MASTSDWLPSERKWLDRVAERLLNGDIVVVRSLPRWGLSTACASIAGELGNSTVLVAGRSFTEASQKSARATLDREVAGTLAKQGYAQLVFDDYGHAIRRSQGGALHSMLYGLLVDSPEARDIGALLIARSGDMLDLNFAGSPLLSRAEVVSLPLLTDEDALAVGVPFGDLRRQVGDSTWLARRFLARSAHEARLSAVEHLNNDRRRIAAALPAGAVEVVLGALVYADADPVSQEALRCLGSESGDAEFELASLVAESRLLEEIRLSSPGWPGSRGESVRRFADLLAGVEEAIWVDRYAFSQPRKTRRFLDELRKLTTARLRILVSRDHDHPTLAAEIAAELDGVSAVEVRFMTRLDRHHLHDRHLVLPATKSGFILPTAGVILGDDAPGSAVSVALPALPIDYAACWRRGTRVFPV